MMYSNPETKAEAEALMTQLVDAYKTETDKTFSRYGANVPMDADKLNSIIKDIQIWIRNL